MDSVHLVCSGFPTFYPTKYIIGIGKKVVHFALKTFAEVVF